MSTFIYYFCISLIAFTIANSESITNFSLWFTSSEVRVLMPSYCVGNCGLEEHNYGTLERGGVSPEGPYAFVFVVTYKLGPMGKVEIVHHYISELIMLESDIQLLRKQEGLYNLRLVREVRFPVQLYEYRGSMYLLPGIGLLPHLYELEFIDFISLTEEEIQRILPPNLNGT
jgi:hypothetical protein